jgi:tetratricopeptide (TPR) repeat protein
VPGPISASDHSIAAHRIDKIAYYAAPRLPVPWPHQVGTLPREAGCFRDRATARQLEQSGGIHVLVGSGGVGKTQLAAHHARTLWQTGQLDLLVWVTAATRDAVIASYAQAAVEVISADPADPESAARAFLAWLEPKSGMTRRWLVVLDDLADPADVRGLWPPASTRGRTLITTRRRDATLTGHGCRRVQVGLFTADEATSYLTTALAAHDRHEHVDALASLADSLGYLPLALSQAVAYIVDTGLDCTAYHALLADRVRGIADALPDQSGLPDDQTSTLTAAWSLSLDRADRLPPAGLARPMMKLAAMLDPNGIPSPVLVSAPALTYLTQHRTAAALEQHAAEVTAQEGVQALRALHRLSLIDHSPTNSYQAVRIHQLVQRAIRDSLRTDQQDQDARAAADALIDVWPEVERDTVLAQTLRANADALALHAEAALCHGEAHAVLFRTGASLGGAGQVAAAQHYFQHLSDIIQRYLGSEHRDTFYTRYYIAHWKGKAGDVAGAVAALGELLSDEERVLGADHPDTLETLDALAYWRQKEGDAAGAVAAYEQLLERVLSALGPDHPEALTARGHLAFFQGEAGNVAGAIVAFEKLLADRMRVLGPDHLDTLRTRLHRARWRGKAGDVAGAIAALEDLLSDEERVLGPDHPDTLYTRYYIAHCKGKSGDVAGAIAAFEELLADRERVMGPDHPDTLYTRYCIAHCRGMSGDVAGAIAAFEELLADRERVMGPDHPDTHTTRRRLSHWREEARALGWSGPNTLTTRRHLSHWPGKAR